MDGGSSTNVLPLEVLRTLGWDSTKPKRCSSSLVDFSNERVYLEGSIELPLISREGQEAVTRIDEFVVVDDPSAYNAILGRSTIHYFRAVPSTYLQVMKFPTRNGMGTVVGQQ